MNRRKKLLYTIAALTIIGLAAAYYGYMEFNRKNESVAQMKPDFSLSTSEIIKAFESDEPAALQRYTGKVIQLLGAVKKTESSGNGLAIVVMGNSSSTTSIRVEMDSAYASGALQYKPGQSASLRAVCTGFSADEFGIGADVLFNRGVIINQ